MKALLFAARQAADALGICFHVGSQAMTPAAYGEAMERVRAAIVEAAVTVDIVDVGGGFPSCLSRHGAAAARDLFRGHPQGASRACPISYSAELWCEPGPGAVRGICERAGPRREAPRRPALHQRRRLWRPVRCRPYRLALPGAAAARASPRTRATWRSASTGRPATISTIWRGRSCCPPTSAPATMSRSACSAPMAARCAPASTASARISRCRRGRADGDALRRSRARDRTFRRTS